MVLEQRRAFQLLGAAVLLGVLGDFLFQDAAWGINIFLWVSAFGLGAVAISKWFGRPIPRLVKFAAPAVLVFAACFGFRDAPVLKFADGLALFTLIGAVLVRTRTGNIAQASIYDLTCRAVGAWFNLTAEFVNLVTKEINWRCDDAFSRQLRSILRGTLIAAPLLLLFGALFFSADDAFRTATTRAFTFNSIDLRSACEAGTIFLFCSVLAAGTYRVLLTERAAEFVGAAVPIGSNSLTLGFTEIAVVLGTLDALFASFVVVQARYFFGGIHQLRSVGGLTYAQYARHGFFELAAVAALATLTILGFHSLLQEPQRHRRVFTILAGTLTAFVFVVLASAFQRMSLYIAFAGLTELRIYTTAFMLWTGLVLIWLAATVLAGNRSRFAAGALVSGLGVILALNAINPDATIASWNMNLPNSNVDLSYLESLSVDAAPAVADAHNKLSSAQVGQLRTVLRRRWSGEAKSDWRGIDLSKWRYGKYYQSIL